MLLVGLVGFVSAKFSNTSSDGYNHDVELYLNPGWNLVLWFDASTQISEDSEIQLKDIKAQWLFVPEKNKYFQSYPDKTDLNAYILGASEKSRQSLMFSSAWIYVEKQGKLKFSRSDVPKYNHISLIQGWNFLILTPDMLGKSLNQVGGNCRIEKAYSWNNYKLNENGFWEALDLDNKLEMKLAPVEDAGLGLIVKITEDCSLGVSSVTPPSIPPEGQNNQVILGRKCTTNSDCPTQYTDWSCTNKTEAIRYVSYYSCNQEKGTCGSSPGGAEKKSCPNGCNNGVCN